jgi:cell division transport system permease protein
MNQIIAAHQRCAKEALGLLLSRPISTTATLLMLACTMCLPIILYFMTQTIQHWFGRLSMEPQITIFMELTAEEMDIENIEKSLSFNPKVKQSMYIEKTDALKNLQNRTSLADIVPILGYNPLPDAFVITPNTHNPDELSSLHRDLSALPMVESVQFDRTWVERIYSGLRMLKNLTVFLGLAFVLVLFLVTHNTIRMQVLARKDEIEVSSLIGAPPYFIVRPFLYFSMWQALFSTMLACVFSLALIQVIKPFMNDLAQAYESKIIWYLPSVADLFGLFILALAFSWITAYITANYHLKSFQAYR